MKLGSKYYSSTTIAALTLVAIGVFLLALAALPATPKVLRSFAIFDQGRGTNSVYFLTVDDATSFLDSLRGEAVSQLPSTPTASFEVKLNLHNRFARKYQVMVTEEREVYIKNPFSSKYVRSADPSFFFSHQAFRAIYPYAAVPETRFITAQGEVRAAVRNSKWQYLTYNGTWQENADTDPSEELQTIEVTEVGQHINLSIDLLPSSVSLAVLNDSGRVIYDSTNLSASLPIIERNGLYKYQLQLFWESEGLPYRGQTEVSFMVRVDLPPTFELEQELEQGELIIFRARHFKDGTKPVLQTTLASEVEFFPFEDGYIAYLPTNYNTAPGDYQFSYGIEGGQLTQATLIIQPREFRVQHLTVSSSTVSATQNDAAYAQFALHFPKSRQSSSAERYYDEPFVIPVYGKLTTEFGQIRYVNNASSSSRHSGLDIAAPTGTPIVATNSGRITLSMNLLLTGNTVVIDHGQGLFSVYYHMHQLSVSEGHLVQRGEQIGTVGSTGFSTGPHLHFMISYYQYNLEPGYFLVGEPVTFANYSKHLSKQ